MAKLTGASFFDILNKDMDDVLFYICYLLEKSEDAPAKENTTPQPSSNKSSHLDSFWDYV